MQHSLVFQHKFCALCLSTLSQDATPITGAAVLYVSLFQHTSVLLDAAILNLTNEFYATCELSKVTRDGFVISLYMSPISTDFFMHLSAFKRLALPAFVTCWFIALHTL